MVEQLPHRDLPRAVAVVAQQGIGRGVEQRGDGLVEVELPCSTSRSTVAATNVLVTLAMRNGVSGVNGVPAPGSASPTAAAAQTGRLYRRRLTGHGGVGAQVARQRGAELLRRSGIGGRSRRRDGEQHDRSEQEQ